MKTIHSIFLFFCLSNLSAQLIPDSLWSVQSERYSVGNPLLEEGVFYTGNEKGKVMAINIADGKVLWKAMAGGGMYHNIISTEKSVIMTCAKKGDAITSLDKRTGKQNWRIEGIYNFDDDVPCQLVKDNGRAMFNTLDSTVVSIDIESGKEIWKFKAGGITSPPVLNDKLVVFTCADGNIYQLSKETGKQETKIKFGEPKKRALYLPPILSGNNLVFSDTGNVITAVSLSSKKTLWKTVCPSPFLFAFNNYVVSATDSGLVAFDSKTGNEKWRVPGRHHWYIYPCVFENKFYYYSRKEDKLLVITEDGKIFSEFAVKGKTYTAPRVTKDKIILSVSDKIFAIENK